MAKRRDDSKRKNPFLPDPDEYYFDDDLDSVTRNLPTEEEYLPQEEEPEVPAEEPVTEGVNHLGVRMIGLRNGSHAAMDDEDGFTPAYDMEDEDDLTAPRRTSRRTSSEDAASTTDEAAPIMRTKTKKQQRVENTPKKEKQRARWPRILVSVVITVVLLLRMLETTLTETASSSR